MAKIDRTQAAALKRLMSTDAWGVLEQAYLNRMSAILRQEVNGLDAFQTLRMLHRQQGKAEGLREFFEDIEKLAFDG